MYEALAEKPAPTFQNGHHEHKSFGDTIFRGKLENLPYPDGPVDIDTAIQAMYTVGYVIFPGVLDAEEVAHMRALMDAMGGPDEKYYVKDWCYNKHIGSDFHTDASLLTYMDRPGIIEVAEAIHGAGCHVTGGTSWITGAGRQMGIHVDYQPISLPEDVIADPRVVLPIFSSTAHYYLNDLVPEFGPTILVPGSHRAGRPPDNEASWNGVDPQAAMVKAGDVVLFRGDLWHGAWMNSHEDRRYIMQVHYANGVMRKQYPPLRYESLYSAEVLERATERQKKLMR
jgi:hypothetical protein